VDGQSQDVAVDSGEALKFVVLGVLAQGNIDRLGALEKP